MSSVHKRIFHLTSACEYSPRVTLPLARVYTTREWDVASEQCRTLCELAFGKCFPLTSKLKPVLLAVVCNAYVHLCECTLVVIQI